jgi:hypothetical protein
LEASDIALPDKQHVIHKISFSNRGKNSQTTVKEFLLVNHALKRQPLISVVLGTGESIGVGDTEQDPVFSRKNSINSIE